jgi:hypothetical protein
MRSDGTDPVQITQRHLPASSEDILASWSPDGRKLVFTRVNTTAEPVGHQTLFVGELILFTSHHDTVPPPGREQLYTVRPAP